MKKTFGVWFVACVGLWNVAFAGLFPIDRLEEMALKDHQARVSWIEAQGTDAAAELKAAIRLQEKENTEELKEIIARYGFPSDEDLAEGFSEKFFFDLVHRSSDLEFQKIVLERIRFADSDKIGFLFKESLADRILLREGKPQLYGTHVRFNTPQPEIYPTKNLKEAKLFGRDEDDLTWDEEVDLFKQLKEAQKAGDLTSSYKVLFHMLMSAPGPVDEFVYTLVNAKDLDGLFSDDEEETVYAFNNPFEAASFTHFGKVGNVWKMEFEKGKKSFTSYFIGDINRFLAYGLDSYDVLFFRKKDCSRRFGEENENDPSTYLAELFLQASGIMPIFDQAWILNSDAEPVTSRTLSTIYELGLIVGAKIVVQVKLPGVSAEVALDMPDMREAALCDLFFDRTLENEDFGEQI